MQWCLEILALSEYGDVMAGKYSGGNRRKLSTAIALVGKPQIVILVNVDVVLHLAGLSLHMIEG